MYRLPAFICVICEIFVTSPLSSIVGKGTGCNKDSADSADSMPAVRLAHPAGAVVHSIASRSKTRGRDGIASTPPNQARGAAPPVAPAGEGSGERLAAPPALPPGWLALAQ